MLQLHQCKRVWLAGLSACFLTTVLLHKADQQINTDNELVNDDKLDGPGCKGDVVLP